MLAIQLHSIQPVHLNSSASSSTGDFRHFVPVNLRQRPDRRAERQSSSGIQLKVFGNLHSLECYSSLLLIRSCFCQNINLVIPLTRHPRQHAHKHVQTRSSSLVSALFAARLLSVISSVSAGDLATKQSVKVSV